MVSWIRRTFPVRSFKGYRFDSLIFNSYLILLALIVAFSIYIIGFERLEKSNLYISCPSNAVGGRCVNPLYNDFSICGKELSYTDKFCTTPYLLAGESLGVKPPFIVTNFGWLAFLGLVLMFIFNHLFYNLNWRREK